MNAFLRSRAFLALLLVAGCDRAQVTEVARTVHQDRKNRILRSLVDCSPKVAISKKGTDIAYSVMVPDGHLAAAMERLRVYGLDRDPVSDEPESIGFDTSESQRQNLEYRRRVHSIERAIAEDPQVFSVSVVLGTERAHKNSPMSAEASEGPRALGSSSVVMRAILDTGNEADSARRLEDLARDVVRGAGFLPTSVAVVALPPLPSPPPSNPESDKAVPQGTLAAGIADPKPGSLGIAASFVLNAVFLGVLAVMTLRALRRNALARETQTRSTNVDPRKEFDRAVQNKPARTSI